VDNFNVKFSISIRILVAFMEMLATELFDYEKRSEYTYVHISLPLELYMGI